MPVTYTPQNIVLYQGKIDVGKFTYKPADQGKVEPNQIKNTAIGTLLIGANIADLVQRATALELEKTGILVNDTFPTQLTGDVLNFKADDLGYSRQPVR